MRQPHGEEWFFFDAAERALLDEALSVVGATHPKQRELIEEMVGRLRKAAELIRDSPSLSTSWDGGTFSEMTLVDQLCKVPEYDVDLHIPTKAVLGQAYLIAKINFLKALGYMVEAVGAPPALRERVDNEVAQSIYSKLGEELFVAILTDSSARLLVKKGAARFLFRIWEKRLHIEVDDFAPILESAWQARSKLLPVLGTMIGTHEIFRLFKEARDKRFLDYFGGDEVGEDEMLAFEEFLFGHTHEEIARLRAHLADEGRSVVTLDAARALLGTNEVPARNAAQSLYTSYKKRRVNAAHRVLTGAPGPKKTAEEYVMIAFLEAGASPSQFAMKAVKPV
jgi:hypothetical protein